jgi:hypothetical protein
MISGGVDARDDQADAERPDAPVLGVDLDPAAQGANESLDVCGLVVEEPVALAEDPPLAHKDPGVGAKASDGRPHVIVELEDLLEVVGIIKGALRGLVGGEDHPLRGVYTHNGGAPLDQLQGVLHLVEAPLGGEDGDGCVVLVRSHHVQ